MGLCQWKNNTKGFVLELNLAFPFMILLLTGLNENPVVRSVHLHESWKLEKHMTSHDEVEQDPCHICNKTLYF